MSAQWIWSKEYNDYYYVTYDANGAATFVFSKEQATTQTALASQQASSATQHTAQSTTCRPDSAFFSGQEAPQVEPAEPVDESVRRLEPNFIGGTPNDGWYDRLDPSYSMRTGAQARSFFVVGRVFAMLYTEAAGGNSMIPPDDDAFTVVRYGGQAYTQIRRFVVVSVRRNFVHACAISTYRNQGTCKRGCDPSEHALVYNQGVNPEGCYFQGERERGLTKEPIKVVAADRTAYLTKESRIRFGKIYSIEWNVKVKDIGIVVNEDLGTLLEHHNYEDQRWDTAA